MNTRIFFITILIMTLLFLLYPGASSAEPGGKVTVRIKDLATIQGNNSNQLIGYGLVTGLKNTGDRTKTLSAPMFRNMLDNMGLKMDPAEMSRLQTKNTAVVMITADLPASFRSGDAIDVTVSSAADATSLEGGVLLLTTLRGADGKVYASAQGPLSVGLDPSDVNSRKKYLVGRIPNGGLIARDMDAAVVRDGKMTWVLRYPDYNTVVRVVRAVNEHYGREVASPGGDRFVYIDCEGLTGDPAVLAASVGSLTVTPDNRARVVVNERTGTVVMGTDVKISPVVISQGNLTLKVEKTGKGSNVSASGPGLSGQNQQPKGDQLFAIGGNATVRDVIDVLNHAGVTPKDLITVLQALKNTGALQGELEIQ